MITSNITNFSNMKMIKAKVEVFNGSTLVQTCTCSDVLSNFTVGREGELGKFFGFGVSHKLNMKLIDLNKTLKFYEGYTAKVSLGNGTIFDKPYPEFRFNTVKVDKKSGDISIEAFDALYRASELTLNDINLNPPYTLKQLTQAISGALGLTVLGMDSSFDLSYEQGGNYNGDELLRVVLNHIAEATQTIYFINSSNNLVFKRLSTTSVSDYYKKDYYEFETGDKKAITGICNATELGDNIDLSLGGGVTQIVRNNGLWETRADLVTLLEEGLDRVNGLEIYQFNLDWSGDYRLEIGDLINIHYDTDITPIYVLNDTINYDGTLSEETNWEYTESSEETYSNASTIGDKINQTFAKVDKVNKEITLFITDTDTKISNTKAELEGSISGVAGELYAYESETNDKISSLELTTDSINATVGEQTTKITQLETTSGELVSTTTTHTEQISTLQLNADSISASVSEIQSNIETSHEAINENIETLVKEVNLKVTSEDVNIAINSTLENGVDKVTTTTGFTFNDEGLNISKSGSEISTTISEDGMTITKSGDEVLVADNNGVKAEDLKATTYLIIGDNSRFENFGSERTACFWIGG